MVSTRWTAGSTRSCPRRRWRRAVRHSLTVYNGLPGYGDLFDLQEDPDEVNNLWYSNPDLRHELVEKLLFEVINHQSVYPKKHAMT